MAAHAVSSHPAARTLLLGIATSPEQAAQALAEGADLVDASAASPASLAAIRASQPGGVLWAGSPAGPLDIDLLVADATQAKVAALAAISTWLGAPVIRTRHTRAARRAIDMAASIAGTRPPALTVRGLA